MKILILSSLLLALAAFADSPASQVIKIEKSYVPIGFDDNDRIQVVVSGVLPNTCYKLDQASASVSYTDNSVTLEQKVLQYPGVCIPTLVPFAKVVELGILREGNYTLNDKTSGEVVGKLQVTRSSKLEADDFLYAPIGDAYVVQKEVANSTESKKCKLHLTGSFSDRCTRLKIVHIHYYPELIIVQPIAERIGGKRDCKPNKTRYSWQGELQNGLTGNYLLHVRSMNGEAVNKIVDLQ